MTYLHFSHLMTVAKGAAIGSAIALIFSSAVSAEAITKPMNWTPPSGKPPGPIAGTAAVLEKRSIWGGDGNQIYWSDARRCRDDLVGGNPKTEKLRSKPLFP